MKKSIMIKAWAKVKEMKANGWVGSTSMMLSIALKEVWAEVKSANAIKVSDDCKTLTINSETVNILYYNKEHGIYITELLADKFSWFNKRRTCKIINNDFLTENYNSITSKSKFFSMSNIKFIDGESFQIPAVVAKWETKADIDVKYEVLKALCAEYNTYEKIKAYNAKKNAEESKKSMLSEFDKTYGGNCYYECLECGHKFTSRYHNYAKCRMCGETFANGWVKELDF